MKENHLHNLVPTNLLSLIDEFSPDVVYIADVTLGRYIYIAPEDDVFGYPSEIFRAEDGINRCVSLMHPEDMNLTVQNFFEMLQKFSSPDFDKTRIGTFTTEYRLKHAKGHWLWIQSKDYIIKYTDDGKVQLTFGLATIINHRKEKENLIMTSGNVENVVKDLDNNYLDNKVKFSRLSEREKEIIQLIGEGLSSKMIAEKLHISSHTAETHRKNILEKLEINNTAELIHKFSKYLNK